MFKRQVAEGHGVQGGEKAVANSPPEEAMTQRARQKAREQS